MFTLFSPFSNCKENTSALFLSHTTSPRRTCIVAALWSWCRGTLGINNNNNNYNKKSVGSFHFFFSFSQLGNHKPVLLAILDSGFFFSVEDWFDKALAFYPSDSSFFFWFFSALLITQGTFLYQSSLKQRAMRSDTEPRLRVQMRTAQSMRGECRLFWQGVVESFGVEWKVVSAAAKEGNISNDGPATAAAAGAAVSSSSSPTTETCAPVATSELPLTRASASEADKTHPSSPLRVDAATAARQTPATPSNTLRPCETTASHGGTSPPALVHFALMPPWSLVEYDPKLWVLLRKNMLANLALVALTVAYTVLSHCLTATSPASSAESKTVPWWWWWRACLWMLKYMGQWPFYTVLQVIGLVWYSQLYRETWLVRKGWVLRGTRLREASALPQKNAHSTSQPSTAPTAAHLPPLSEGVTRPWLATLALNSISQTVQEVGTQQLVWQQASLLLHALVSYNRHVAQLVGRMLRHKGPTTPLQEWVLGDAAAAAVAAARHIAAASSPQASHASPDIFESLSHTLESTSEVIFKALATMSFAFFASCVERLPLAGTPLCLLLNAQLYAFYVFDYRYATQQQPGATHSRGSALTYQLRHFEQCWVYYAGYGIGSAVLSLWLTHHVGFVVSVCAMSVLYSWQVVWSGFAVPLPSSRALPVFSLWFYAVDTMQKQYAVLWRTVVIVALLYIPYQCICYL